MKPILHFTDFPRLHVKVDMKTYFDANSSLFYFICDWSESVNNNTAWTVYSQWFRDDVMVLGKEVKGDVTMDEISHREITGLQYSSEVCC